MADKKSKTKKMVPDETPGQRAMNLGFGLAGANVGNQATSFLEKQSWLGSLAPHAASITTLIGAGIYIFAPWNAVRHFGYGMAMTGGAEEVEGLIGMVQGSLGMSDEQLRLAKSRSLGKQPSAVGKYDNPFYAPNGTAIN